MQRGKKKYEKMEVQSIERTNQGLTAAKNEKVDRLSLHVTAIKFIG